jgi:flagellar hook-associated protein 3 FlgL
MLTNLDASSELFLTDVSRIQRRLTDSTREASSGKRMTAASDRPDEIAPLLQLRSEKQRNLQIQSNLTLAKTDADAADNALNSSIKLMDRALTLATQGSNSILDATGRQSLASEVRSLQEQMVAFSQTTVQGRYIFSGDRDLSPSYALDLTATSGVTQLLAAPATCRIEDPAGGSFASSKAAQEIFDTRDVNGDPAADNVFAALNGLRLALESNDPDAAASSIPSLKAASDHLNAMQSFYGTIQNRIRDASDFASSYDVQLKTEIGDKEDADVTAAALEATQASTQLQAAFQMRAKLPHTSLFDYLG